jgi:hypothetical protein
MYVAVALLYDPPYTDSHSVPVKEIYFGSLKVGIFCYQIGVDDDVCHHPYHETYSIEVNDVAAKIQTRTSQRRLRSPPRPSMAHRAYDHACHFPIPQ